MSAVILYGPKGCGKTTHAKALAAKFGCELIVDGWDYRWHKIIDGALHLTCKPCAKMAGPDIAYTEFPKHFDHTAKNGARSIHPMSKRHSGLKPEFASMESSP